MVDAAHRARRPTCRRSRSSVEPRQAARRYGLKPGDVRRAAAALVAGEEVGDIFRGGKAYDVQRLEHARRPGSSLDDMRNLPIDTPAAAASGSATSPTCELAPTPNVIKHEDASRRIDVGANVAGRDLGSVARDLERRLDDGQLPARATTRRCSASTPSGRPRRTACCSSASARAVGDLPPAAGGVRQLAAGHAGAS